MFDDQLRGAFSIELVHIQTIDALDPFRQGRIVEGHTSPEFDFSYFETCIAFWETAQKNKNPDDVERWQTNVDKAIRMIERLNGAYWLRRAETRLAASAAGLSGAGNYELLVRMANNYYQRKQVDDAVSAFELAGEHAFAARRFP